MARPRKSKTPAASSAVAQPAPTAYTYTPLGQGRKVDTSPKIYWDAFRREPREGKRQSRLAAAQADDDGTAPEEPYRIGSVVMVKDITPLPPIGVITQIWTVPDDEGDEADQQDTASEAGGAEIDDEDDDFVPLWCKIRFLYWPENLTQNTKTRLKGLVGDNEIFYTHKLPRFGAGSRQTNRSQAAAEDSAKDNFAQGHSLLESDGFTVADFLGHAYVSANRAQETQQHPPFVHQGRTIPRDLYCTKAVDFMKELFWTIDYDAILRQGQEGKGWDLKVAEEQFKGKALTAWAEEERKRAKKEGRVIPGAGGGDDRTAKKSRATAIKKGKTRAYDSDADDSSDEDDARRKKKPGRKRGTGASKSKARAKRTHDADFDGVASSSSSSDSDSDSEFDTDTDEEEDEDVSDYEDYGSDDEGAQSKRKRQRTGAQPTTPRKNRRTAVSALARPTPRSRRIIDLRREARTQMQDRSTNASSGAFLPNPTSSLPFDFESAAELDKMTPHQRAKRLLHVSTTPSTLPCRSSQAENLLCLLEDCLDSGLGSCIYISGVPGTGKTATVRGVIAQLQQRSSQGDVNPFDFLEINGMKVADAAEAYSMLWSVVGDRGQTSGGPRRRSPKAALNLLSKHYSATGSAKSHIGPGRAATIVLMDELDQLLTSRQDVMYNLFNWPSSRNSRLIVVAVANTMDLPERTLNPKVASRLGMTRITFMPYTDRELGEIVRSRLGMGKEGDALKAEAQRAVAKAGILPLGEKNGNVTVGEKALPEEDGEKSSTAMTTMATTPPPPPPPPPPPLIESPQDSPATLSRHTLYLSAIAQCDSIFADGAITYAAKRISNVSGDARRMLDVCRRAVEMKESECEREREAGTATTQEEQPISIHDIRRILDGMVKSARPSHISRSLSIHAKILLVSLLHLTRKTGLQEIKLDELEVRWRGICRLYSVRLVDDGLKALSLHSSLLLAIDALIHLGLVIPIGAGVGPGKARGWNRVMLASGLREDEVRLALEADEDSRVRGML